VGALQPPLKTQAAVAMEPATVEHADALESLVPVPQAVGAVHPPENVHALVAPAPTAVEHAIALALPAPQPVGGEQPVPLNEQ
jgi:hypothetical protein